MIKNKSELLDIKILLSILLVLLLPNFVKVTFSATSLAAGLLISTILVLIINYYYLINFKFSFKYINIYLIIITFILIPSINYYINKSLNKPIYSILAIFIIIFSAWILSSKINKMSFKVLSNTILLSIIILIVLGWIKILYNITCCNYYLLEKPVFPFSEESHYALAIGVLSVAYSSSGSLFWIFFIEINIFLLSFLFPNLTLLVFVFLNIFAIQLRVLPKYFILTIILTLFLLFLLFIIILIYSDYFSSRLTFHNSSNLTTLVYLQGWDMAYINLIETDFLGLNFQMLGLTDNTQSIYTEKILNITGKKFNITDGSFLASKIISEFGIIGIYIILYYIIYLFKSFFYINKLWSIINGNNNFMLTEEIKKNILMWGILFGFSIEVFLRGYGYFSPNLFLVMTSLFYNINSLKIKFT